MNPLGYGLVVTYGLWILGIAIILTISWIWCNDVNQKLRYILEQLEKIGRESDGQSIIEIKSFERKVSVPPGQSVSALAAVFIIGTAILVLFIIPIYLINR